jgi:hypothetical protein
VFDKFFVGFLYDCDLIFYFSVVPLYSLHDFEEHFIGTTPLWSKSFLLQESDFEVVNAEFSDGLFEMIIIIAIESRIAASIAIEFFPHFNGDKFAHFPIDLSNLLWSE